MGETTDQASKDNNQSTPFDLTLLKENPQVQQLLLLALSAAKQQNEQPSPDNDKRKYDQLDTFSTSGELAALSDHGSPESDSNSDKVLGRPGRKPLTEDDIQKSATDPKSKRKAQNRAAQRAFRERRVNYVKELEDRIKVLEENQEKHKTDDKILEENQELKKIIQQLQMENAILGGTASSFDMPLSKLGGVLTERPQKLLRSAITDDSPATLYSVTTPNNNMVGGGIGGSSSSPDSSFAAGLDEFSSPSTKSRSLTPADSHDDNVLFTSSMPTDILNSLDTSHPFSFSDIDQQAFFNSLTTDNSTTKSSTTSTTSLTPGIKSTDESNDLMASLLVMDDDDDEPSLAQVWNKVTEHPRFDEFDIDALCDEMKNKVSCSPYKSHNELANETINKLYPPHSTSSSK
ncbi:hypothetical protein BC941DRAFT_426688 [Chlamydoabsidia padenii]|nr:hypothetical protein BC941DRAFT_426688 [Chlamydoabsidia padenii]